MRRRGIAERARNLALLRAPTCASLALAMAVGIASPISAGELPRPVSPGIASGIARIGDVCPTFNWAAARAAASYELAVYEVAEDETAQPDLVVTARLPGTTSGWTPPLGRCLERGKRYAWTVRAWQRGKAGRWSRPGVFEVAGGPTEEELLQALETVRAYLASHGAAPPEVARAAIGSLSPTIALPDSPDPDEGGRRSKSLRMEPLTLATPDTVGITSEVLDVTGVTFGIHGTSASSGDGSAGVVGESTAVSGEAAGVYGRVSSPDGYGGVFEAPDSSVGGLLRGVITDTGLEVFKVTSDGDVKVGGSTGVQLHSVFFGSIGRKFSFDTSQTRFELSDPLQIADNLIVGTGGNVAYNAFGGTHSGSVFITDETDLFVADDMQVGEHLFVDGGINLAGVSDADDDEIGFDDGTRVLKWDESDQRFDFNSRLRLADSLVVGTSAIVGYNAFGGTTANAQITQPDDVFVDDDLEVKGTLFAEGGYGCGSYVISSVCPRGHVSGPPACDEVPVGSFCEADGTCGLGQGINNCGTHDWYFRTD